MTGRDPAFAASPSSPCGSRPSGLQSGVGEPLVERLCNEADLCRNEGADDIANLLDEARAALDASGKRPDYCEPREFLLIASYCGDDNDACTEKRPCADCLAMCNVFDEHGNYVRELGQQVRP